MLILGGYTWYSFLDARTKAFLGYTPQLPDVEGT